MTHIIGTLLMEGRFGLEFYIYELLITLDNINYGFVLLTTVLYPLIFYVSGFELLIYEALLVLYMILVIGFMNSNYLIFLLLFEQSLITIYYLFIQSSSDYKIRASFYLFIFSLLSTLIFSSNLFIYILMLIIFLSYILLILGFLFTISLGIKIPLFPFHDWLSIVHSEALTSISLVLGGLMLKLGIFAILRFVFPLFYMGLRYFSTILLGLVLMGIILALTSLYIQLDYKIIIALSSISHMNLNGASILSLSYYSVPSGIVTSLGHGFSSISLFLFVGFLTNKTMTRIVDSLWWLNLSLRISLFIFLLSNISFPGTLNFIGEILAILSLISLDYVFLFMILIFETLLATTLWFILYNRKIIYYCMIFQVSFYEWFIFSNCIFMNCFYGTLLIL